MRAIESFRAKINLLDDDLQKPMLMIADQIEQEHKEALFKQSEEYLIHTGKVAHLERQLRIIRRIVNRYFKTESEELSDEIPF